MARLLPVLTVVILVVSTILMLLGAQERAIEIEMVLKSRTMLSKQQRQIEKLVVESQKMKAIGNALLKIFTYNLNSWNAGEEYFQKCMELATQEMQVQIDILEKMINRKELKQDKTLKFWLNRERKLEFTNNIVLLKETQKILTPWHCFAKKFFKRSRKIRAACNIT